MQERCKPIRALACLVLIALIAGCGSSSDEASKTLVCPSVIAAPDLDVIAQLAPGGSEVKDVRVGGQINAAKGVCRREEHGIAVDTLIYMTALRSDLVTPTATLPYFVAITDGNRNILGEQPFDLKVEFFPGESYRTYTEAITAHLPLKNVNAGGDYLVIVGFKLTQDQLAFNRAQRNP